MRHPQKTMEATGVRRYLHHHDGDIAWRDVTWPISINVRGFYCTQLPCI